MAPTRPSTPTRAVTRARRRGFALALGLSCAAVPYAPRAAAESDCDSPNGLSTCIDADNLWLTPGKGRWHSLAPTAPTPNGLVHLGLVLGYLSRPIGLQVASPDPEGTTVNSVDDRLTATMLASVGVGSQAEITLAAPMVLYQNGASIYDVTGESGFLPRSALGDVRFGARVSMLHPDADADGVALAARFELAAPTGDRDAFVTTGAATYVPGLGFEHRVGIFSWGLDGTARIRPVRELAGARMGPQLGLAAGANVDILADGWLSASLEAYALFTLVEQHQITWDPIALERVEEPTGGAHIPAEWLLGVQSAGLVNGQVALSLAGGGFIPTGDESAVTTPRFRFLLGAKYVPDAEAQADEEP